MSPGPEVSLVLLIAGWLSGPIFIVAVIFGLVSCGKVEFSNYRYGAFVSHWGVVMMVGGIPVAALLQFHYFGVTVAIATSLMLLAVLALYLYTWHRFGAGSTAVFFASSLLFCLSLKTLPVAVFNLVYGMRMHGKPRDEAALPNQTPADEPDRARR